MTILHWPFFAMRKKAHALPPRVHVVNGRGPIDTQPRRRHGPARLSAEGLHFSAFHFVLQLGCVSISQHLTSGVSVRFENAVTYSTGNKGQNIRGDFSETALLQRSSTSRTVWLSFVGHSLCRKMRMRIYIYHHARVVNRRAEKPEAIHARFTRRMHAYVSRLIASSKAANYACSIPLHRGPDRPSLPLNIVNVY